MGSPTRSCVSGGAGGGDRSPLHTVPGGKREQSSPHLPQSRRARQYDPFGTSPCHPVPRTPRGGHTALTPVSTTPHCGVRTTQTRKDEAQSPPVPTPRLDRLPPPTSNNPPRPRVPAPCLRVGRACPARI